MIQEDNKLARTRKTGYKKLIKEEKEQPVRDPNMFSYEDFDTDDFFFGKDVPKRPKDIEFNIKIN